MGQSVTNLAGAAMRVYDKVVHEQIFTKNVLWNNVLKNIATDVGSASTVGSSTTGGGGKMLTVHYKRNVGSAAGSETVVLPTAGSQGYLQASVPMKYNFQTVSLTDVVLQSSKRNKEFLVNALDSEYKGAREDMKRQLSRQGYGTGTGVIAQLSADVTSDATVELDNPMVGKNPTDYLEIGNAIMTSAAVDSESTAVFGKVSTITDGDTFELVTAMTTTSTMDDNDYLFIAHNATSPSVSNQGYEVMGLKGLIDDNANVTTLQGLSRDTYIWWKSYVNDATSQRSLSDALMHDTYLEAKKKGNPKFALTSFDVFSAYGQLLTPDRRYTDKMSLKGGFTGVMFNDLLIVADYDCPYDEMYFIDPSSISAEDLAPISFLNEDGSILDRSSTTPAWNATLRYYANLAINAPNKNSALRDIIK